MAENRFTLRASNLDSKDGILTRFEGRLGDINGDGIRDDGVVLRDPQTSKITVVVRYGTAGRFDVDPGTTLDGKNGFEVIDTRGVTKTFMLDPVAVGDVNGDRVGDFIIPYYDNGSYDPNEDDGFYSDEANTDTTAFVVFGRKGVVGATFDLADIDGTNGFAVGRLAYNERFGYAVSSAGDINGDGIDDVLIGAPGNNIDGLSPGRSYVVFGKAGGFTSSIDVTRLDGRDGFKIAPATTYNGNGLAVAAAGDVNGDGVDDLIVSEPGDFLNDEGGGSATYIVFGRKGDFSSVFDLKTIDGGNGFKVTSSGDDNVGISVASAGDVNGDGFDDIVVGVGVSPNGVSETNLRTTQATAYVVFGNGQPIGPVLKLESLDGTNGFEIDCGTDSLEAVDVAVSTAGDFNGDGFADVLIGVDAITYQNSKNYPGKGIIVLGKASGFTEKVAADGVFAIDNMFQPRSEDRKFSRINVDVASVGDTNGDGLDDVVIGANGSKYLIYGRDTGRDGIIQVGDDRANTLLGSTGADSLRGLGGNDTYRVDNVGDRVIESRGDGTDAIVSSITYTLAEGQEIETLQLASSTGKADLKLTGNEFNNTLRGNGGANVLQGGAGIDALYGRAGNDTYAVDRAEDRVFEAAGQGNDAVVATVSYALQAGQEIETLQLARSTGTKAFKLNGNEFANTLLGNGGANSLNGQNGSDTLTGRGGADTFVFSTKLGSGNVDRITDFASDDTIRLEDSIFTALTPGALAASAFKNISTGKADADDHILYKQATGQLFYDADGGGKGAAVWFATLDNKIALTAADILIV